MAKQKTHQQLTRKQIARHEKEAQAQRLITRIAIAVVALIVLITVYGIVSEVTKARRPVARVDDQHITRREFEVRQYYSRWLLRLQVMNYDAYISQLQASTVTNPQPEDANAEEDPNAAFVQQLQLTRANLENQLSYDYANLFASQVLDQLIEEELVRIEAASRGLTVTDDAVERAVEIEMGYDRDAVQASETVSDTLGTSMTEAEYKDYFEQFKASVLNAAQFKEADYREMLRTGLLRDQLIEALSADLDSVVDQVQTIAFTVDSEEEGNSLRDRLNSGEEDVAAILEEVNANIEDTVTGYELPYLPIGYIAGQFTQDIERAAFNTPVGRASEPLMGPGEQYFVIYVQGHEERELSPDIFGSSAELEYNNWLTEQIKTRTEYLDWEQAVITEP